MQFIIAFSCGGLTLFGLPKRVTEKTTPLQSASDGACHQQSKKVWLFPLITRSLVIFCFWLCIST